MKQKDSLKHIYQILRLNEKKLLLQKKSLIPRSIASNRQLLTCSLPIMLENVYVNFNLFLFQMMKSKPRKIRHLYIKEREENVKFWLFHRITQDGILFVLKIAIPFQELRRMLWKIRGHILDFHVAL